MPSKNYPFHNQDNLEFLSLANVFNENSTSIFEKLPSKLCRKFDIHIPVQIFFIFHIVSDVVNIYQYAKVYRTTNTGAGASFFPLKCTMCTLYSSIALWSKPEIQKPLSQIKENKVFFL